MYVSMKAMCWNALKGLSSTDALHRSYDYNNYVWVIQLAKVRPHAFPPCFSHGAYVSKPSFAL